MKTKLPLLLGLSVGLFSQISSAAVWQSSNTWDEQWERQYSQWVAENFNRDIFINPESKYYGMKTDCADAAYTMRAIYSFENKLPFVINCPWSSNSRCKISSNTSKYNHISNPMKRFKAFNNYFHNVVSSRTISKDTYPPFINRDALRAGGIFLQENKHVYELKRFDRKGYGVYYWSTTPRIVRKLSRSTSVPDLKPGNSGFRMWKNPQNLKSSINDLVSQGLHSNEQHTTVFKNMSRKNSALKKRMSEGPTESNKEFAKRLFKDMKSYAIERVSVVNQAYSYCQSNSCNSTAVYDLYSTPGRDKRLLNYIIKYKKAQKVANKGSWFADSAQKILSQSSLEVMPGVSMTYLELYKKLKAKSMSTDPRDPVAARWGL